MEFIYVEPEYDLDDLDQPLIGYLVRFEDENGSSILSRQKTKRAAENRAVYFRKELTAGRLLREDANLWE